MKKQQEPEPKNLEIITKASVNAFFERLRSGALTEDKLDKMYEDQFEPDTTAYKSFVAKALITFGQPISIQAERDHKDRPTYTQGELLALGFLTGGDPERIMIFPNGMYETTRRFDNLAGTLPEYLKAIRKHSMRFLGAEDVQSSVKELFLLPSAFFIPL